MKKLYTTNLFFFHENKKEINYLTKIFIYFIMDYKQIYDTLFNYIKNNNNKSFMDEISKHDELSFDINIRDNYGKYFLNYAIIANNIELVNFLLKKNARIDIENDDLSILAIPIHFGYNSMLEILLETDKKQFGISLINFRDRNNKIPLHHAIEKKNIDAINILLKYNSNVNIVDKDGYNSLFYAIKSRSIEIVKLILPHISNINAKSFAGENVLHISCNLQLVQITEILIKQNIMINAIDTNNELSPLHYSVLVNNNNLVKILLNAGANINIQDVYGNTPLHYIITEKSYEIFDSLHNNKDLNFNLWNIEGELPLHIFLKNNDTLYNDIDDNDIIKNILNILILNSNLNIQDKNGMSALTYIASLNLIRKVNDLLRKKKLDIFVKNKNNETIINMINKKDYDYFIDIVVDGYLYNLKYEMKKWTDKTDILCSKEPVPNKCKNSIKKKIINMINDKDTKINKKKSYPFNEPEIFIDIDEGKYVPYSTFTGSVLDILIGLIFLMKKYDFVCSVISNNMDFNKYCEKESFDREKCELLNFEIIWANKKLSFNQNFKENFISCAAKKKFVIIPLGIEMKEGSHAGYIIYDVKKKEIERFETYGGGNTLYGTYYNPELLDSLLEVKFKDIDDDIKYIKPFDFLPKIGFQLFDIVDKQHKKIGDPIGFCALWSIWYVDMRLSYHQIPRDKLVKILISIIKKENLSFKNVIRNYSADIVNIRDDLLKKSNLDINDWINNNYDREQYFDVLKNAKMLL
ncbi:ankyrin repeat/calcium channel domain-containing protein [Bodo saltans virus]|uniref:Ankyrin repeat/calcium channel domain-containing protein n=1 Tax=Bodo saltans virus TaxID=2024608 RepID=A0A2H4UUU5_9VIRU|nr:ankyrin repeat/calcium channel domain-containing protein [Bodo saltans virus]ATZ80688.1 ankyrin repeat/calcium channel domain-containing protein [Bodo saltans virus]